MEPKPVLRQHKIIFIVNKGVILYTVCMRVQEEKQPLTLQHV